MRRSTLWVCALLATATLGCKQVNEQVANVVANVREKIAAARERFANRGRPARPAPAQPQPAAPAPAAPAPTQPNPLSPGARPTPEPPSKPPARPQHLPATAQAPEIPRPSRDVPYISDDTGTIAPGMSETDVYSLWGPAAAVRHSGGYTYLYFRNACEYSCGMLDLVTLQNGQVVDAVLRWDGHRYSGQSSSPKATKPHYTPGGDTLTVRPPSTP